MEISNTGLNGNLTGANASPASNPVSNVASSLGSILNVSEPASASAYGQTESSGSASDSSWLEPDWATLSTVGSTVAQTAAQAADGTGVREDKVAAVRTALAAGTYSVAPSAVAGRAVEAMLGAAS